MQEFRQALDSLGPGKDLDLRGTTLDGLLLRRILEAYRDVLAQKLLIGNASLENATVNGGVSFSDAIFDGDVRVFGAEFHGEAKFCGTEFKAYAGFNYVEFKGYTDFGKAKFSHGPTSFKNVNFRSMVEFEGTSFKGRTEFNGAKFRHNANFFEVQFEDEARFGVARFYAIASFQHGRFRGTASFGGTRFTAHADFVDAQFDDNSSFGNAKFDGDAWFLDCGFSGKADFSEVRFNGGAWFSKSCFGADVSFVDTKIAGDALFADVTFAADVRFDEVRVEGMVAIGPSVVGGELGLDGFEASGTVEVTVAANRVKCIRSKFSDRVWLSLVGGDLWLVNSVFAAPVTIESSLRPVAGAASAADQKPVRVRLRSLRGMDAEHLTLIDADLSRCVVSGVRRPEQLRLEGRCVFAPTPRGLYWRWRIVPWRWSAREALFEEHLWRASEAAPGPHGGWAIHEDSAEDREEGSPERLEVVYRQLRAVFEVARNEPGAADFYYGEMEMRRRAASRRSERWLLGGYWFVSGYGLRGGRALGGLMVLIFSSALALQYAGFPGPAPR